MAAKFKLGRLVITPAALEAIPEQEVKNAIDRHAKGDWGNLSQEDIYEKECALKNGARILSSYELSTGEKFWVITEADRSATTVLLPSDY